jgi:hypothetical protein
MIVVSLAAALAAGLMLLPAGASARSKHKHKSCPKSARVDRNHDRIPDRWECRHHLSLKVKQTKLDPDHDGLNNQGEFQAGDDPHKADSDNDGVKDGNEHAGTIQSFVADPGSPNTGTLTVALDGGGTVSGKVTADTECKVEPATPTATASSEGDHGSSGDDNSNPGSGPRQDPEGDNHNAPNGDDNGNNDQNETDNEHGDGNGSEHACTAADLTTGRTVKEAELKLDSAGATFKELKLG